MKKNIEHDKFTKLLTKDQIEQIILTVFYGVQWTVVGKMGIDLEDITEISTSKKAYATLVLPINYDEKHKYIIYFYDNKFLVDCMSSHQSFIAENLSSETYQKKYIKQMYKIFGNPYKKNYFDILQKEKKEKKSYINDKSM